MATTGFLHGVQVIDVTTSSGVVTTVASSVIGLVGTAPNADPSVFPLNTPVVIAGSNSMAAKLSSVNVGNDYGTLPGAVQDIFDIIGAVVIVVRVDKGLTDTATQANIVAGCQVLKQAQSLTTYKPRILIAPGYTHQRTTNGVSALVFTNAGAGYTDGTYSLVVTNAAGDNTGAGAAATATVSGGVVTEVGVTSTGSSYTAAPTFAMPAGAGTPGTAAVFSATIGTVGNAVVAEMIPIAQSLRAVIIQDGPNTTDADAIAMAGDFDSERVYLVDPWVTKLDQIAQANITRPSSPSVAGEIAWVDNNLGFWWSPSNQSLSPVLAVGRPIDFVMGDATSGANLLNAANVATIIYFNGYRLWGNRTLSSEANWVFLCVVRTRDIINDSLMKANQWAVDRGITKGYVDSVIEEVNNYLRYLVSLGAILGGTCFIDPDLNPAANIKAGKIRFDFKFTPVYPAEEVTFGSQLVDDYITTIF